MTEPLGDKLFHWLIIILVGAWALGWIILLSIMFLEYLFPRLEKNGERILNKTEKILSPIMKYSLFSAGILFLIRLLAGWLGWAKQLG